MDSWTRPPKINPLLSKGEAVVPGVGPKAKDVKAQVNTGGQNRNPKHSMGER